MNYGSLIFTVAFSFAGFAFLGIAFREWKNSAGVLARGIETEGTVVETVARVPRRGERPGTGRAPVVQFTTPTGEKVTYTSGLYSSPCPYRAGDRVRIWYLPDNPGQATLGGKDAWLLPILFGTFGLVVSFLALAGWVRYWRMQG